ncbi:MAG: hypothetical protein IJ523_05575 [Succinivibrionaceae bacterium]|nr:hypothetical protein [Succinivibrionaceae bacterium]
MNLEIDITGAGGLPCDQNVSSAPAPGPDSETVAMFNDLMSAKDPAKTDLPTGVSFPASDPLPQNQAKPLPGEKTAAFAPAQESFGGAIKTQAEAQNRMTDLSSMFSSAMFAGSQPQQTPEVATQPPPAADVSAGRQEIQDLVSNLLDRILVSDPKTSAGSSVMMQMSSSGQFAGTEIVLTRSNDGTLAVVINAGNQEQYRKLNEAKSKLENSLERLEKGSFTVTVKSPDSDDQLPS